MACGVSSAIFALIGTVIGAVLGALTTIRVEKMRLHNKESREAHKRLFVFSQQLSNRVYPLAGGKQEAFEVAMRSYLKKHRSDSIWFSLRICKTMRDLEEHYLCLTEPDLREENQEKTESYFSSGELFKDLETLTEEARKNATKY